jgi:hypothetical protein
LPPRGTIRSRAFPDDESGQLASTGTVRDERSLKLKEPPGKPLTTRGMGSEQSDCCEKELLAYHIIARQLLLRKDLFG